MTCLVWIASAASFVSVANAAPLKLEKGDHICLIGNTLAERMQHHGWLETLIQSRFAGHELVFRNLGFSGDELTIRLRSMDFGTPDQWLAGSAPVPQPKKLNDLAKVRADRFELANTKADVIFAFFGYNESFAGPAGLEKFRKDLDNFIKHTLSQKYNGRTAPRLVLFSPISHENLGDRNLPDGRENNARLRLYTAAMAEVAAANGVLFVDLFAPTLERFNGASGGGTVVNRGPGTNARGRAASTINGIHLNLHGDQTVARIMDEALFGAAPPRDPAALEKLRQAVNDKNRYWFLRYRAVDGYSTYGERAFLKFVDGQSNYEVVQRELEALDVMTANRDRRVWALAQNSELKVDDGNTPAYYAVKTNKPGPGPKGEHLFESGDGAIHKMKLAKGMKINLFASEEMFPDLAKPVQMTFDARGRMWVAVMPSYPHWKPGDEMNDKVLIFEDADGDGRADKCTTFADKLHVPTGLEFYNGGLLIGQQPDLMFLKDTDGDDRADVRERVLHGMDSADTHHALNSFTLDPGGTLYFQEGTFHHTQVETPWGPPVRCANAGVFRFEPRASKFEVYVSYPFANPHGHVFDRWGQDFVTDGTGNTNYFAAAFSGHVDFPRKHARLEPFFKQRTRPCPGTEILSSRHFPDDMQGDYLVANVIGFQGILQYKFKDNGSGFGADEVEPIVQSSDPNFRPSDLEIGPDGAIYFIEWQNPIIGHMQHNLRDPSRDQTHGRVYRITCEGRPLLKPAKIAGQSIEQLLDLLKAPENRVRYRAKIELGARDSDAVIAALAVWVKGLDKSETDYEHHMLEALWLHQYHNVVNDGLLRRMLRSPDYRARAAATRVLCYWRDRVSDSLALLKAQAADEHPRVRLEAVRAASFFNAPEAVEVALAAAEHPTDYYLDYVSKETLATLEPYWKARLAGLTNVPAGKESVARFYLRNMGTEQLLRLTPHRLVFQELLLRPGLRDEQRRAAAGGLARMDDKPEVAVLLDAIAAIDKRPEDRRQSDQSIVFDLARLLASRPTGELAGVRAEIERLATSAHRAAVRQISLVSLINTDGSADAVWRLHPGSGAALLDKVNAVPLISDASVRATLYSKLEALLDGIPSQISPSSIDQPARIRHAAMLALTSMRGQEAKTFKMLAGFVRDDGDRAAAIRALQRIPRGYWPKEDARPLLDVVLAHLRQTPIKGRTSPAALDALEFADALAALLPADQAKKVRNELGELGVRVVRIGTLLERMAYDKDIVAVKAGKPVEFVLENSDLMPHNFVITEPGAMAEIGALAEATATDPAAAKRHFVPTSSKILLSSALLQPRDTQKLSFVAPSQPGIYPYVCTYPGHWRRMFGALYVVADLDAYLANPDGYLAKNPLAIKDDLLKDRRPRTEWKFDDLGSAVREMKSGRNFGAGKQMFQAANCMACHKLDTIGNEFGPDLAKLDPKFTPIDILKELLEPSAKINEKFQTYVFSTESGGVLTGIIVEERVDSLKIVENPLVSIKPTVIKPAEVVERKKSPISIMPKGLLDRLTRDEILDLIAYLASRGDRKHPFFHADHDHGGH